LNGSTDEVLGTLRPAGFFREDTAYALNSSSSASKAAADHLVHAFHNTYGLPTLVTKCSNTYEASKVAADVMVQEDGRYFGVPTCCLRGGCLTGPAHTGVELHGFLSSLVTCNREGRRSTVLGYHGQQVRDNIHAADVARFIERFIVDPRPGDHICYASDIRAMQRDYPGWRPEGSQTDTFAQIVVAWMWRGYRAVAKGCGSFFHESEPQKQGFSRFATAASSGG
jgi:dTDP-D-glucose 4,6-dehydratase